MKLKNQIERILLEDDLLVQEQVDKILKVAEDYAIDKLNKTLAGVDITESTTDTEIMKLFKGIYGI